MLLYIQVVDSVGRIIRVFPRRTNATPTDSLAIVGRCPDMFDEADEVHVSVSFSWDIPLAEKLAKDWERVAPVKIGGPAFKDSGSEFVSGRYVREGYVITSRGCPNSCWFCEAWKNEGRTMRELTISEGWNLLDNNIFACSREHQQSVYEMLARQGRKPRFTGGLEAARMRNIVGLWISLKRRPLYLGFTRVIS